MSDVDAGVAAAGLRLLSVLVKAKQVRARRVQGVGPFADTVSFVEWELERLLQPQ
jgi:hypothetical protein